MPARAKSPGQASSLQSKWPLCFRHSDDPVFYNPTVPWSIDSCPLFIYLAPLDILCIPLFTEIILWLYCSILKLPFTLFLLLLMLILFGFWDRILLCNQAGLEPTIPLPVLSKAGIADVRCHAWTSFYSIFLSNFLLVSAMVIHNCSWEVFSMAGQNMILSYSVSLGSFYSLYKLANCCYNEWFTIDTQSHSYSIIGRWIIFNLLLLASQSL